MIHLPGTPVGALVGYHLFVRQLLPGVDAEPIRVELGEDPGVFRGRRGRRALLVQPGTWRRAEDGRLLVDVLPGRRLTPYARAEALVLRESVDEAAGAAGDAAGAAGDADGAASRSGAAAGDLGAAVLALPL